MAKRLTVGFNADNDPKWPNLDSDDSHVTKNEMAHIVSSVRGF